MAAPYPFQPSQQSSVRRRQRRHPSLLASAIALGAVPVALGSRPSAVSIDAHRDSLIIESAPAELNQARQTGRSGAGAPWVKIVGVEGRALVQNLHEGKQEGASQTGVEQKLQQVLELSAHALAENQVEFHSQRAALQKLATKIEDTMQGNTSPHGNESSTSLPDSFGQFEEDSPNPAFTVNFSEDVYGSLTCPCLGVRGLPGDRTFKTGDNLTKYPPDTGTYCEAWDDGRYAGGCEADGSPGQGHSWCAVKWCFVDPCNCAMVDKTKFFDAKMQYHGRPLYYSYATCGEDTTSHGSKVVDNNDFTKQCQMQVVESECLGQGRNASCAWTGQQCIEKSLQATCVNASAVEYGDTSCRCINVEVANATALKLENASTVNTHDDLGGRCNSWQAIAKGEHCTGAAGEPAYCKEKWCFVDPCTCSLENFPAIADRSLTVRGTPVHFSYETCAGIKTANPSLKKSCTTFKDYMSCHDDASRGCSWDIDRCIKESILKECKKAEPGLQVQDSQGRGARGAAVGALILGVLGWWLVDASTGHR